ncbi:putative Predicted amidohydrolase [uncultured delta proteobacterium]|uniref:Putative Predicted amidohydrolase n=1 Tax=uncultured delta proteobacterium TaxID=34034 RepID=A0A212KA91_9DELT|nr:putative Predicted amidohydrolase [uncultured delta proteobacterium]
MVDLKIVNGIVMDPAQGTESVRDLYVHGGCIVEPGGNTEAMRVIDAAGCYVTPGFIDTHIHLFARGSEFGAQADLICLPAGVTTAVDAGSAGIFTVGNLVNGPVRQCATTIKVLLHPSNNGVQGHPHEEPQDPAYYRYEKVARLFEKFPRDLVGLKIRFHDHVPRDSGLLALENAAATADKLAREGYRCILDVHFGDLAEGLFLEDILSRMRPGDVMAHLYRGGRSLTIDENGRLRGAMFEARARGVCFETACSRPYFSLKVLKAAVRENFYPDIISTDLTRRTMYWRPAFSMAHKMTAYLAAGMPLQEVVAAVTSRPAAIFGLEAEAGSLRTGRPADIAVFKVENRPYRIDDLYGESMAAEKMVVPMATIKNGAIAFQQITLGW